MSLGTSTPGLKGAGGGSSPTATPWDQLPAGADGDRANATLGSSPIVAERGPVVWHPGYPTAAQLASLWPAADQSPGVRVGPMPRYWRAKAEGRAPKVLVIGDSTTSPGWLSVPTGENSRASGWPAYMASLLGWRDGSAYAGSSFLFNNTYGPGMDARVTYSAPWAIGVVYTMGDSWAVAASPSKNLVFTPTVAFDSLVVKGIAITGTNAARTQVYVDDVLKGELNHDDNLTRQNPSMVELRVSVTRGSHVVRLTTSGASGNVYANAIETYDSQSLSPNIFSAGRAGLRMLQIADTTLPYSYKACIEDLQPDVVILSCVINDLDNGDSLSTVLARNQTFFDNLSRVPCDFVGVIPWCCNRPSLTKENFDAIRDQFIGFAQARNGSVVDGRGFFGDAFASVNPSYYVDNYHLSASGNQALAAQIAKAFQ